MIYEERKMNLAAALILLSAAFLLAVSPWLLGLRELAWYEGAYTAMIAELDSYLPVLRIHGEPAQGAYPLYPLLAKALSCTGLGLEYCLRLIPGISLLILCTVIFITCYRAAGISAATVGTAVMLSSLVVIDKVPDGLPTLLTALGIFSAWMVWFDFASWRGRWHLAWILTGAIAGLTFYAGGWQALVMLIVPLLFLRRPLSLKGKPRGYGFAIGFLLTALFILLWGGARLKAGFEGPFRPDPDPLPGWSEYLTQIALFPIDFMIRLFPWSLFVWAPFCPALITLDKNPLLGKYLRTLFSVLVALLWFTPGLEGREFIYLVPPFAVLLALNYWIAVRRYGVQYQRIIRTAAWILLVCSAAVLFYHLFPGLRHTLHIGFPQFSIKTQPVYFFCIWLYPACALLLSLLLILRRMQTGTPVWQNLVLLMTAAVLLNWGVIIPSKTDRSRSELGYALRDALAKETPEPVLIYKNAVLRGLYSEAFYSGAHVRTMKSVSELPSEEQTIYVLSPDVPARPDRVWKNIFSREYRRQNLNLWKGELRQGNEQDNKQ